MDQQDNDISILAGNSRVSRNNNGEIIVQAQLNAFDAALRFTRQCVDNGKPLPRLSVAFDHHGIFRLQFLDENLSNSQKRRPRLNHLHPSIRCIYQPVAEKYRIALSDIHAIHEDSARQHLAHTIASGDIPERLIRRMLTGSPAPNFSDNHEVSGQKLTCAAITKEYFERASGDHQHPNTLLEVFFENSDWSESLAYVRGLQLSHLLGVQAAIRLNLVNAAGEVSHGEQIAPRLSPGQEA
ncbi:hypothetical protein N5923_10895 [Erwiniaceae bacterium BAC15a-03b]|uniref:Uncharacterized protein n=1 Tax=Winslowiella arboricola TaxID=2978220 RepID=A0A9J6PTD3_9GAMM|nr:hypothetical protein [Winslowiella arboricola]MCU5774594.1 hypothetical protein [Winslowiella arboricola]MCU5777996.1 hypothetical protein [Winslowiella arboricola]